MAREYLHALASNSATGPDDIPAKFLKECADQLAVPFAKLSARILESGIWPDIWRLHRVVPLYKRGASSDVMNYRGVHLTSHISKVIERILKHCMEPVLYRPCFMGSNQFA